MNPNERAAPRLERDPRLDEQLDQRLNNQNTATERPLASGGRAMTDARRRRRANILDAAWRLRLLADRRVDA